MIKYCVYCYYVLIIVRWKQIVCSKYNRGIGVIKGGWGEDINPPDPLRLRYRYSWKYNKIFGMFVYKFLHPSKDKFQIIHRWFMVIISYNDSGPKGSSNKK